MAQIIENPLLALENHPKMMTLVFMDLESTGLPTPGNYPRMTELSMIAIDTVSLTTAQDKPPRVRNKLTLCMYPMRTVSLGAFRITGLYNDNLFYQKDFDAGTADLINIFLNRLAPPVCLVAHNGLGYDYPLMLAEYKRVGKTLPESLYVCDSLPMFRILDPDTRVVNKLIKYSEPEEDVQQEMSEHLLGENETTNDTRNDTSNGTTNCASNDENQNGTTYKKDVPRNHKTSVKRKLFEMDDEDAHSSQETEFIPNTEEVILFDDHDYADDVDDDVSLAGSDATQDYYGCLPGIDEIMDDVEEAERTQRIEEEKRSRRIEAAERTGRKKDEKDGNQDEWDSDMDDIDDDTLLSNSLTLDDDQTLSGNSQSSNQSQLSQLSNSSSLLLTPPDSERKRNPPTFSSRNGPAADAQPSGSQANLVTTFKKYVMPSTPISDQTTPKRPAMQNNVTPGSSLKQTSINLGNSAVSLTRTVFKKFVMPGSQSSPTAGTSSQITPSSQMTPQKTPTEKKYRYVAKSPAQGGASTPIPTQNTQQSQSSQSTFKKYVMPISTQNGQPAGTSSQSTQQKSPAQKKYRYVSRSPAQGSASTPSPTQNSHQTQASQNVTPTKTVFKKYVMPGSQGSPSAGTSSQTSPQQSSSRKKYRYVPRSPAQGGAYTPSPTQNGHQTQASQQVTPTKTVFKKYVMPGSQSSPPAGTSSQTSPQQSSSQKKYRYVPRSPVQGSASTQQDHVRSSAPPPKTRFVKFVVPGATSSSSASTQNQQNSSNATPRSSFNHHRTNGSSSSQNTQPRQSSSARNIPQYDGPGDEEDEEEEPEEPIPGTSRDHCGVRPTSNVNPCASTSDAVQQPQGPRKSYRLEQIYLRTFGEYPPVSHKAEDDAVTLMRICYRRPHEVCDWIDENAELFSKVVQPMYENKYNSAGLPPGRFPYQL